MTVQTLTCTCGQSSAFEAEPGEAWECPECGARNVVPGGMTGTSTAYVAGDVLAVPLSDEGRGADAAG